MRLPPSLLITAPDQRQTEAEVVERGNEVDTGEDDDEAGDDEEIEGEYPEDGTDDGDGELVWATVGLSRVRLLMELIKFTHSSPSLRTCKSSNEAA